MSTNPVSLSNKPALSLLLRDVCLMESVLHQYQDLPLSLIHEDQRMKAPSRGDVRPQYVHHVAPKPPAEDTQSGPKHKGTASSSS